MIQSEIKGANEAIAIKCDVSKEAEIEQLVAKTVEKFGRLDVMLYVTFFSCFPLKATDSS